MINQAPIVRYTASVSETFFPNSWRKTFSAESQYNHYNPYFCNPRSSSSRLGFQRNGTSRLSAWANPTNLLFKLSPFVSASLQTRSS